MSYRDAFHAQISTEIISDLLKGGKKTKHALLCINANYNLQKLNLAAKTQDTHTHI